MIRVYIFLFLTLISGIVFGQESKGFRVYTNVFQNIDLSHPRINIGIEKDVRVSQSLSFGIGYYYYDWITKTPSSGLNINIEYKRIRPSNIYYALGINVEKLRYVSEHSYNLLNDTVRYSESFHIDKVIGDLYVKLGYRTQIGNHFYFDIFGGLGMRIKKTQHFDRNYPFLRQGKEPNIPDIRDKEGQFLSPIIKLGLIVGIKI